MSGKIRYIGIGPSGTMVVAAGPLVKQPCTLPYRLVLLEYVDEGKYSVHRQGWDELPEDTSSPKGSSLQSGDYFHWNKGRGSQGEAFAAAVKRFGERLVETESGYMGSVYRN